MLAFDIQVRTNNKLDALSQRLVLPFVELGKVLAIRIRERVLQGIDPTGRPWSPLGRQSMGSGRGSQNGPQRRWWVAPTEPQPAGWLFKVPNDAKDFKGFAVYESYETYLRASPGNDRRDWYKTGTFWRSIAVRPQAANRVKVISSGSRKVGGQRIANRDIGYYAGRNENFGVLTYSDADRAFAVDFVSRSINEQYAMRVQQAGELQQLEKRAVSWNRRASKLLGS
jgi:hypothetical protein